MMTSHITRAAARCGRKAGRRQLFRALFGALLCIALAGCAGSSAGGALQSPAATQVRSGEIQSRTYFFEEAGAEIPYDLYVPRSYRAGRPSPLVVVLHGLGSSPAQVIRYQGLVELAEARGYIVVAPMGYNSRGWYGSRGPGRTIAVGPAADDPENLGELSERDVLNVLRLVQEEFDVDPRRTYLMGHSMGGGGTLHLAMKYPQTWAALAPVAPAIYSSPEGLRAIRHIPVIMIQGELDRLVRAEVTRRWAAMMQELGMRHQYVEVPGGDHTAIITRDPANMQKIFDFFDEVGRDASRR
jgi:poly(3-hydroxybutyrate) depolymerase